MGSLGIDNPISNRIWGFIRLSGNEGQCVSLGTVYITNMTLTTKGHKCVQNDLFSTSKQLKNIRNLIALLLLH